MPVLAFTQDEFQAVKVKYNYTKYGDQEMKVSVICDIDPDYYLYAPDTGSCMKATRLILDGKSIPVEFVTAKADTINKADLGCNAIIVKKRLIMRFTITEKGSYKMILECFPYQNNGQEELVERYPVNLKL
jgi:hypothetical protein